MARSRDGRSIEPRETRREEQQLQNGRSSSISKQLPIEKPKEKYHMHIVRTTETLTSDKRDHINAFLGGSTRIIPVDFQGSTFPSDDEPTTIPSPVHPTSRITPVRDNIDKPPPKRKARDGSEQEDEDLVTNKRRREGTREKQGRERDVSSMDEDEREPYRRPRDGRAERERTGVSSEATRGEAQRESKTMLARSSYDGEGRRDRKGQTARYDNTRRERESTPPRQQNARDAARRSPSQSTPKKMAPGGRRERSETREVGRQQQRDRSPPPAQGAYQPGTERDDRSNRVNDDVDLRTPPRSNGSVRTESERGGRPDTGKFGGRDRTPVQRQRSPAYDDDEPSERVPRIKEKERVVEADWVTRRRKKERVREGSGESSGSEDGRRSRSPRGQRTRSDQTDERETRTRTYPRPKSRTPQNHHTRDPKAQPPYQPPRQQARRSVSPRRDRSLSPETPFLNPKPLRERPMAIDQPAASSSNLDPRLVPRPTAQPTRPRQSPDRRSLAEGTSRREETHRDDECVSDRADGNAPRRTGPPTAHHQTHDDDGDMTLEVGRNRLPDLSTRTIRRDTEEVDFDMPWGSEDLASVRRPHVRASTHDESDSKSTHAQPAKPNKAETAQRLIDDPKSYLFKGNKRCTTCIGARMNRECWAIPGKRARCAPCIRSGKACGFCEVPAKKASKNAPGRNGREKSVADDSEIEDEDEEEDEDDSSEQEPISTRNRNASQIEDVTNQISKALASVGTLNEMVEAIDEEKMTGMDKVFRNILGKLTTNLTKSKQDLKKFGRKFAN